MFSSNPGTSFNPNANIFSSNNYLHCPPLFAGYENNNVLLNPLTGWILPAANHQTLTNMAFTGNASAVVNREHFDHPSSFIRNEKPVPVKRDRHSKICTAQGFRDRRVRLSIEIAREFFDLQDMLGFDKASQTLEWLFNKSRKAIKELIELKRPCNGTSKQLMEKLAKKSRDQARARARQRTREKMLKKFADTTPQISTQIKACQESSSYVVSHDQVQEPCSSTLACQTQDNQAPTDRNQNPSSNFAHDQQNLEISKDTISCNTSNYNFNLPQNWDIVSAMPHQYTVCRAITKHESLNW